MFAICKAAAVAAISLLVGGALLATSALLTSGNAAAGGIPPSLSKNGAGPGSPFDPDFRTFLGACSNGRDVTGYATQNVGGNIQSDRASMNFDHTGLCGGVDIYFPNLVTSSGRTFFRFGAADGGPSQMLGLKVDTGTVGLDTWLTYNRSTEFTLGLGAEHDLLFYDCVFFFGFDDCAIGVGLIFGFNIFEEELLGTFDQTSGGGGITRLSDDRTAWQPFVEGQIFNRFGLAGSLFTAAEIALTFQWRGKTDDLTQSGTDSFNRAIMHQVDAEDDVRVGFEGRLLFDSDILFRGGRVASDRRLKRAVVKVAELAHGIGLYRYRYSNGAVPHLGVMAQEVLDWNPDAVVLTPSGALAVDYAAVFADPEMWAALKHSGHLLPL